MTKNNVKCRKTNKTKQKKTYVTISLNSTVVFNVLCYCYKIMEKVSPYQARELIFKGISF